MTQALYIILMAINNRLRGSGLHLLTSKPFTSFYAGVGAYFLTGDSWILLIVFLGMWLWAVLGWGKYFSSFHGRHNKHEKEVKFIDVITDKIKNPYLAGTVGMSLRGLFIMPMFAALAFYLHNPLIVLYGLVCALSQGLVYASARAVPEKHAVTYSEVLYGAIIGTAVTISLGII